jgi:acyl-CoA thioesterase I
LTISLAPRFPFRIVLLTSLVTASAVPASIIAGFAPIIASAQAATYACANKAAVTRLAYPLAHMAQRIATGHSVTIVALGSSSTAGAGASGPAASYPSRLEAELKAKFPGLAITVLNRGVNGDVAADMLARFDESVAAEHPDVVLWQVGTNAVLRDEPLGLVDRLLHEGVARIKAISADVILMDPQFAPKVIFKADAEEMIQIISSAAKRTAVDIFPRFAVMREWHEQEGLPFEAYLSADLLHMNDWGYDCLAKLLSAAMVEAVTRSPVVETGSVKHAGDQGR